jgi:hypothetical protein
LLFQVAVKASSKEGNALEVLRAELDLKTSQKDDLQFKVDKLTSEIEAKDYDEQRSKDERDQLMTHYEQQIKKLTENLTTQKVLAAKMLQVKYYKKQD